VRIILFSLLLVFAWVVADAQQTVFNVPSADVLDSGKIYGELDVTCNVTTDSATFTPRVVLGISHRIEVGLNVNGFGLPGEQSFTPTPTLKWRVYSDTQQKWSWLVGDDVLIPAQNSTYAVGDYVWTEAAHKWNSGTRATFGMYYITGKVAGAKQKVGGQFAFEWPLNSRASFATDWFTGDSSIGYVTPGVILRTSRQLTWYGAYQIGNHALSRGNHQFLFEIGWNFN